MRNASEMQRVPARWTPDCQGKQDFDGVLVSLSTRYWPSGGGFHLLHDGKWEGNDARPEIRPSAHATIYLGSTEDDHYDNAEILAEGKFEADTEDEVKQHVEAWANTHYSRIQSVLRQAFAEEA